jgi:hypothetical protein
VNVREYYLNCARDAWARRERLTASLINQLYRFGIDPVAAERAFYKEANG